ncbi:unnamed protein product [Brachionus calyciflorus]|uniref:Mediator complex subunit 27 n=1 Tax=Brachionus calyciflorus TaxID=104777 RepID=A0A813VUC8_9BILA|nr:unnamed protein product [Brachionus calyciflorus]
MAANVPIVNPAQRMAPNMMPVQTQPPYSQQSQAQHQTPASTQQQTNPPVDPDQKKIQDMFEAINLIANLKEDINTILENVGKANSANNYSQLLSSQKQILEANLDSIKSSQATNQTSSVGTPASVSNAYSQNPSVNAQNEPEQNNLNEPNEKQVNLNEEEADFFEKTDNKFMNSKIGDINKSLVELEKIFKDLQPVTILFPFQGSTTIQPWQADFYSVLLEQTFEEKTTVTSSKMINNYRYLTKLQENCNLTNLTSYKRFQQSYAEKKYPKYKSYNNRLMKKEEMEKTVSALLGNPDIKVVAAQKTEHQFVLDIIMPQNFKFVFLLFDLNVERLQVRPMDSRILKIYTSNKPSDEICFYDFDYKNKSNVFQRLEENCLFAWVFFKTEFGINHISNLLKWIKNFKDLFNAKCSRCEKHLLNGIPPTWRDLKTYEPYHDECRIF